MPADPARITLAYQVLTQLGVSLADLQKPTSPADGDSAQAMMPTVAQYLPQVVAATLTWVERHFGYGIARAYAGHTDSTGAATTTYIKADLQAAATALAAMTGQPHRLSGLPEHSNDPPRRPWSLGLHGGDTRPRR